MFLCVKGRNTEKELDENFQHSNYLIYWPSSEPRSSRSIEKQQKYQNKMRGCRIVVVLLPSKTKALYWALAHVAFPSFFLHRADSLNTNF